MVDSMKIALINDTHWGARGDSLTFMNYFRKFYDNVFFPYLEEHNIKTLIHLGDVVDRRKFINFKILNDLRTNFVERLWKLGIDTHIIIGNHDTFHKNTNELNSLQEKLEAMQHKIFDNLTAWQISQVSRHPQRPYTQDYIEAIF